MEKVSDGPDTFRSTFAQFLAAMGFSITNANIGLVLTMPTIVIGALRNPDSPLYFTESQVSWFGSLIFIVQPIASVMSGFLQNRFGRKTCLMLINIPQLTAWLILYYSTSVVHLFIAEALMGLSIGFLEAPLLSYVGEVTQPRLRGVFSCFAGIFYNLGCMLEAFLGATLPWRSMVLYSALGPLVGFTAMALLPDSPAWLITKGRVREAERAYQWLRGWVPPEDVKEELEAIMSYVQETQRHSSKYFQNTEYNIVDSGKGIVQKNPRRSWQQFLQHHTEPEVLVAFRIILSYFAITSCASLLAMRPFFIVILDDFSSSIRPENVVAICGVLQLLGSIVMSLVIKPLGKRRLTFLSLGLNIFCCFGIGGYVLAGGNAPWVPVSLFCLSYFSGTLGIVAVPWILAAELFPLRAKSLGSAICAASSYFFLFIVIKTYHNVVAVLDIWGTCFMYGTIGVLGLIYLYFDLPETEGQPLQEIERKLSQRSIKRKNDVLHQLAER